VVLTQSHPDHVGGWAAFDGAGVETIAQAGFPEGRLDSTRLRGFLGPRVARLMGAKIGFDDPGRNRAYNETPEPEVTTFFERELGFEVGGRRFELLSAPGGETRDGVVVWLPAERTAFSGNLLGALFPQVPHLSTIRGDRPRGARLYVRCVDQLISLEPELLITGHGEPIEGAETIAFELGRLRDGAQYVYDETIAGMNAGKDLWTLMREIELPAELRVGPNRGPTSWNVRAVWEEHAGWFRFESTTELYGVPAGAVAEELGELAGGPEALAERGADHVDAGRPLEALHLTDVALAVDPDHARSLAVQLAAHEILLDRSAGWNFDEVRWLETEIERLEARLEQVS
jgi:glyoxylase-like metal-dependent hydrolase (beta-lactamase superfamily II)